MLNEWQLEISLAGDWLVRLTTAVRHGPVAENGVTTYREIAVKFTSVKIGVRDSACSYLTTSSKFQ